MTAPDRMDGPAVEADGADEPRVTVVGSGKGGVGKSVLAVLLAAALARRGRRVLLLDGAQNQGNLHLLLGVRPAGRLRDVVAGECGADALVTPVADGLALVPGESGEESMYALGPMDRARLHHQLCALYEGHDEVIVDVGPGIESAVRAAAMRASRLLVVAMPEPTALADAYALIKLVTLQVPSLPVHVVANRVVEPGEGEATFERLSVAAERFLGRALDPAGDVAERDDVRRAARRPGGLLALAPPEIEALVDRLFPARPAPSAEPVRRAS